MADVPGPLDEAVERVSRGRDRGVLDAPRRADPLEDAVAVAASVVGGSARSADPESEADLEPTDAVLAASGLMAWRIGLAGRWWAAVTTPLLVRSPSGPAAVVPVAHGSAIVDGGTRRVRRLGRRSARLLSGPAAALAGELPGDSRWWHLLAWSLGRHRADLWLLLALGLAGGIAGLLLPLVTGIIFEAAVPDGDIGRIVVLLAVFAVGSVGAAVLALARGRLIVRIRDRSDSVLGPAVMAHLLRLRSAFFRSRTAGDVVNRVLSVDAARQQVDDAVLAALVTAVFGLSNLIYLAAADVLVGLVSAAATVVALGASIAAQLRAHARLPRLLEARSRSDATLLALLDSLSCWRTAGAEARALARWATDQGESTVALHSRLRAIGLTEPINVAAPLAVVAVFVAAVMLVSGDQLTPGSTSAPGVFLGMYAAVAQLAVAMVALANQLVTLSDLGPVLDRLQPVVVEPRERGAAARSPGRLSGAFSLSQVVFGYRADRPPLFDGLDLAVEPGELLAVVGPSGSGKSTLLRLLLGFEEPWDGSVSFDGHDLSGLDPVAVRRQLGVVLQASRPLGATVRECVGGARRLDDDEIWSLLEQAGLADDVRRMPRRLQAPVGDHGLSLSGGQRQRLMLAAALAGRPRMLLLDEATSALDTMTQTIVMRTIVSYPATRVVVAHRLSTVRRADRVVVVDGGRIAEEGTPEALLAAGGHFARLAARQVL
ncbi:MAG: ATP-binding cassette domain-containing protein [Actinobacteria bacterium]|nr:ATP-binding cassette domain-containing protein [Actinomycetota bacterium]